MDSKPLKFDQLSTKRGDLGETTLADGTAASKDDPHFEVLGDIDELSSWLGLIRSTEAETFPWTTLQHHLGLIMAQTANHPTNEISGALEWLEGRESELLEMHQISSGFILPGNSTSSARIDIARSICRRAERHLVGLISVTGRKDLQDCRCYLNRLSDYLFIAARVSE